MPLNIIAQIVNEGEKLVHEGATIWHTVVTDIEADVAKITGGNPAAQAAVAALASDVKQGASDALGVAGTMLGAAQPLIVNGAEAAANAALLALTGGKALPALPGVDGWLEGVANAGIDALKAWLLKQKAGMALVPVQAVAGAVVQPPAATQLAH